MVTEDTSGDTAQATSGILNSVDFLVNVLTVVDSVSSCEALGCPGAVASGSNGVVVAAVAYSVSSETVTPLLSVVLSVE